MYLNVYTKKYLNIVKILFGVTFLDFDVRHLGVCVCVFRIELLGSFIVWGVLTKLTYFFGARLVEIAARSDCEASVKSTWMISGCVLQHAAVRDYKRLEAKDV